MGYFIGFGIAVIIAFSIFYSNALRHHRNEVIMLTFKYIAESKKNDFTNTILSKYIEKFGDELAEQTAQELYKDLAEQINQIRLQSERLNETKTTI
jgi:hypothetical protein